jgi:polygalacturonase
MADKHTASSASANAPALLDLTIDNITPNAVRINSQSGNPRLTYLMERLVTHLHDFARETRLSTDEWMATLQFLVECGKISSDVRQVCYPLLTEAGEPKL